MKFAYSWLREFVDTAQDVQSLAHNLTMAGLEVEQISTGAPFSGVVVARVVSVDAHPQADRLKVCQVDVGEATPRQVVCGAPDVAPGMFTACALPGAVLAEKTISAAQVRGIDSSGMLCSAQELGLASDSEGLLRVDSSVAPGTRLEAVLGLDETVLTLKLTPNRSDCLSVLGVAREVSAISGGALKSPEFVAAPVTSNAQRRVALVTPGCARYCGRIIEGIRAAAATPAYIAERLASAGIRSHSAVVDITNYVMLEIGQPMHAFDAARLSGDITVREAQAGESLELLNQNQVTFNGAELLICDADGPLALAGVMGGAASAVSDTTQAVFLESAFFLPAAIAGVARRYGIASDSAYRFERGVDFELTRDALERATALILEICGGQAGPISEAIGELPQRLPIALREQSVERLLGIRLPPATITDLLRKLGLRIEAAGDGWNVVAPSFRFDLTIEADLIEEIARIYGYDNIPAQPPLAELLMLPRPESRRTIDAVADLLCARDYQEIVSYSFVDAELQRDLSGQPGIALANPIASQMSVMRSSLLPGLLQAASFNLDRQQDRLRLFEIGRCFEGAPEQAQQPWRVGGLCIGSSMAEQWGAVARPVDFYDVKGDIEALFGSVLRFEAFSHPAAHPGQSARIFNRQTECGWLGTLHPKWQQKYNLRGAVVFEIELAALLEQRQPTFQEVSKFPSVMRDIACIVDDKYAVQMIIDELMSGVPDFIRQLTLFDIYRGKGIDSGKKSLAFRVVMQDTQKTLSEDEIEQAMAQITRTLQTRFAATLR